MDKLEKAIKDLVKEEMKEIRRQGIKIINGITKDLYKEAYQMYDSFIDQFYTYETHSYWRHGAGIGTRTGVTLYRASNFRYHQNKKGLDSFEFNIEDPSDDYPGSSTAPGGKNKGTYKYRIPTDEIYDYIINGKRFYLEWDRVDGSGKSVIEDLWSGHYDGKYFKTNGNTTILQAFNDFDDRYDDIAADLLKERFHI